MLAVLVSRRQGWGRAVNVLSCTLLCATIDVQLDVETVVEHMRMIQRISSEIQPQRC